MVVVAFGRRVLISLTLSPEESEALIKIIYVTGTDKFKGRNPYVEV